MTLTLSFQDSAVRLRGVSLDLSVTFDDIDIGIHQAELTCLGDPIRPYGSSAPLPLSKLLVAELPMCSSALSPRRESPERQTLAFGAEDSTLYRGLIVRIRVPCAAKVTFGPALECYGDLLLSCKDE